VKQYNRNCPICNKELTHCNSSAFNYAVRKNSKCKSCARKLGKPTRIKKALEDCIYERTCPICDNTVICKTKTQRNQAEKKGTRCRNCYGKTRIKNPLYSTEKIRICPDCLKEIKYSSHNECNSAKVKNSVCRSCSSKRSMGNPEYKQKILNVLRNSPITQKQRDSARENLAKVTNTRPIFEIWKEKYSPEEVERKIQEFKDKQSFNNSGSKNKMYGKPSPQGSGNGWKGHYKGTFFRSLRELSMLVHFEENNVLWVTGESKKYKILYIDPLGKERNYFPDFITDTEIIECKPKRLWDSPNIKCKTLAAKIFAESIGLVFTLVDPPIINYIKIVEMLTSGIIVCSKKYEEKIKAWKEKE